MEVALLSCDDADRRRPGDGGRGKGYGPPIAPEKIVDDYKKLHSQDPTRPVLLNLGQGVAWDGWYGRAVRMEDKPAKATFRLTDLSGTGAVEVLGEQRTLSAEKGRFTDDFAPYDVHLYKVQ